MKNYGSLGPVLGNRAVKVLKYSMLSDGAAAGKAKWHWA